MVSLKKCSAYDLIVFKCNGSRTYKTELESILIFAYNNLVQVDETYQLLIP